MYFGSVRFFRHLILSTIALLIIVPVVFAVVFSQKSKKLTIELDETKALTETTSKQLADVKKEISLLKAVSPESMPKPVNKDEISLPKLESEQIGYQALFPDMKADIVEKKDSGEKKIIYLTFDDGPSPKTKEILALLDLYEIKATFFVVFKDDEFSNSMYKEIADKGHALGVHSASHDYKKIYESVEAYLTDFNKMYEHIFKLTGQKPTMFRFPGGSINSYNSGIYMEIISEMTRRGFTYYDWNVSAQDASDKATDKTIHNTVTAAALKYNKSVVLMHDSSNRAATVKALPRIIDDLYAKGYAFDKLDPSVKPFLFSYNKPF